jgi:hypothetical protein
MATEVAKLLCLDQVNQYKTTNGGFKWKLIEIKLKADEDKGNLGEERYRKLLLLSLG